MSVTDWKYSPGFWIRRDSGRVERITNGPRKGVWIARPPHSTTYLQSDGAQGQGLTSYFTARGFDTAEKAKRALDKASPMFNPNPNQRGGTEP